MDLHKMTWSKIDKFFDSDSMQESLTYAGMRMKAAMQEYTNDCAERFADYLKDEFRLLYGDIVRDEVKRVVREVLLGNQSVLSEYNLAPADWGIGGDHYSIRSKLVEDHADIIKDTHMQALEDQLKRTQEMLETARGYR